MSAATVGFGCCRGLTGRPLLRTEAKFPFPAAVKAPGNPHMRSYSCPPGSLLLFTESLLHASADWTHKGHPR